MQKLPSKEEMLEELRKGEQRVKVLIREGKLPPFDQRRKYSIRKAIADEIGRSESHINHIFTGVASPSYDDLLKILQFLDRKSVQIIETIEPLLNKALCFYYDDLLVKAREKMLEKDFSQAPVIDHNNEVIGTFGEGSFIDSMIAGKELNPETSTVGEFMSGPLKSVSRNYPIVTAIKLLREETALICQSPGNVEIITKADILSLNPKMIQQGGARTKVEYSLPFD